MKKHEQVLKTIFFHLDGEYTVITYFDEEEDIQKVKADEDVQKDEDEDIQKDEDEDVQKDVSFHYGKKRLIRRYNRYDKLHNKNGPAETLYYSDGTIRHQYYYINGEFHREGDKPAKITWRDSDYNCTIISKEWYDHGKLHRKNGAAKICYHYNNTVDIEYWYQNGKLHNKNGPAEIHYDDNGIRRYEEWYIDGKESYNKYGRMSPIEYKKNGEEYTPY